MSSKIFWHLRTPYLRVYYHKYIDQTKWNKIQNGHKCPISFYYFFHDLKILVHLKFKYTSWTSMQRYRKSTLKFPSNTHSQKYQWLITTVKILSMHTSYKHQLTWSTLNTKWTVHFHIKYIGLALFSYTC